MYHQRAVKMVRRQFLEHLILSIVKVNLRSTQDKHMDTDGAVHAYSVVILCGFWAISWKLVDAYLNTANGSVPQVIVGVVECH